jgi:hypothetical protein
MVSSTLGRVVAPRLRACVMPSASSASSVVGSSMSVAPAKNFSRVVGRTIAKSTKSAKHTTKEQKAQKTRDDVNKMMYKDVALWSVFLGYLGWIYAADPDWI